MDCSSITDFQQSTAISIAKKFRNLHIGNLQLLQFLRCCSEAWIHLRRGGEGLANPRRRRGGRPVAFDTDQRIQASGNQKTREKQQVIDQIRGTGTAEAKNQ